MSDGGKRYEGQIQVVEGSSVGEFQTVDRFAYNNAQCVEFIGQAKVGTPENQHKHYIYRFYYDSLFNVIAIKQAKNMCTTKATQLTVDLTSNPGYARIEIQGGEFDQAYVGDALTIKTTANPLIVGKQIVQKLNMQEVLLKDDGSFAAEIATAINDADLTVILCNKDSKPYDKRRWDKRDFYYYE